jgi:hypothetical protein
VVGTGTDSCLEKKVTPPTSSPRQGVDLAEAREGIAPPSPDAIAKLESVSALPQKDGRVDMEAYAKYKEGGLRRKIHDAIRAKKCIRCFAEGHLRSSCPEGPRSWEDDFNRGKDAFWKPQQKQSRPQWLVSSPSSDTRPRYLTATIGGKSIMLELPRTFRLVKSIF